MSDFLRYPLPQRGAANPLVVLAIVAVVLLLATMLYITLDNEAEPAAASSGSIERLPEPSQSTAAAAGTAVPTVPASAAVGDFVARQLPPPNAAVPATDSPVAAPPAEGESVLIGGRLLEAIEVEAAREAAETGGVPLSPPQ